MSETLNLSERKVSTKFVACYDTKPYQKELLIEASQNSSYNFRFFEFLLNHDTVLTAAGSFAVSVFVNDVVDRYVLTSLSSMGIKNIVLRCAGKEDFVIHSFNSLLGFNNLDIQAAKELGFTVTRSLYSPYSVSEYTVALVLSLSRKIHKAFNRVREMHFALDGLVGFELHGRTVGVIGTGQIGKLVAQTLFGFGMKILAYDPYQSTKWAETYNIKYVELTTLLKEADIITLHLPLNSETKYLISTPQFMIMKKGSMLINTSRGEIIDTKAMIQNIKNGKLGGVALDVFEEEEVIISSFSSLNDDKILQSDAIARLLTFPNVIVTAHQGYLTSEALKQISATTCKNLAAMSKENKSFVDGSVLVSN